MLRVRDKLDLTQDTQHVKSPNVSEILKQQAESIFQAEQAHLVQEANLRARRKEVLYVNDYG